MIKFPRSLIYILKIIGVYEILKNIYVKHFKFLGILKDDIETSLFFIFLNIKKKKHFYRCWCEQRLYNRSGNISK